MQLASICSLYFISLAQLYASIVQLDFEHLIENKPLRYDSVRYANESSESYSSTRLSYLASAISLRQENGEWFHCPNSLAWIDGTRARTEFSLGDIPNATYTAIRFHIGIDSELNHADPARYSARHPLNPNLNNLHWDWQGGYIFLALEGHWRRPDHNTVEGYAYHYATDAFYTPIELPIHLNLVQDTTVTIGLQLDQLLRELSFARDGATTHSSAGDPVALQIQKNLLSSLRILNVDTTIHPPHQATKKPIDLPKDPTPYPITLPSHIPLPELPLDNPIIAERVELGEKLFHDPILSRDNTLACASCHQGKHLTDPRPFSLGVDGQIGTRHAMPLFNLAWKERFFWDGRAASLREQVLIPIEDHLEMDSTLEAVAVKLENHSEYPEHFAAAFKSAAITPETISLALENFLLTQLSFDSKIDQVKAGIAEFTEDERRGFELFFTESEPRLGKQGADCFHCHGGAHFTNHDFNNNGLPGDDLGLYLTTGKRSDRKKFSTPSLRNIAETAPYMHDGRFQSLEEVIDHYNGPFERSETLDPNLAKHPNGLALSESDKTALIAFLKTL